MCHGQMPQFPMSTIKDELRNPWHKEEEQQKRIQQGVEGVHLCIPFQCGVCWMRNLEGRDPIEGADNCFMACIKRANIEAMAGKLPFTIGGNLREITTAIKTAIFINKTPSYHHRGPFPLSNLVGMGSAVDMLLKSLVAKGWLEAHVQFSTLRRLRAMYTKSWESSPLGVAKRASFAKGTRPDPSDLMPHAIGVVL
jgi:hypothetical protein